MKLKCQLEDFQVAELTEFSAEGGPFALYRLTKRAEGTLEAVAKICKRWQLARRRVSYGGLKDKHALAQQFLTIERGPPQDLTLGRVQLKYLGQAARHFTPRDIHGNRFQIVVRDLAEDEVAAAQAAMEEVRRDGLPNYFDDQRFGSLGKSGEFIARAWCAGDYERALWLALADPCAADRRADREQKRLLRERWGDWVGCRAVLDKSPRWNAVNYLAERPTDFRGALARLPVDLRGLYLSAFQSFLWNQMLANLLRRECPSDALRDVDLKIGSVPFFRTLTPEQRTHLAGLQLPLPSARLHLDEGSIAQLIAETLSPYGLELRRLRVKYPRDTFFAKGTRAVLVCPTELSSASNPDEVYPGSLRVTLHCELPRSAYATIVVKRLFLAVPKTASPRSEVP
jgi:tRNA pseudouridine13 synthase